MTDDTLGYVVRFAFGLAVAVGLFAWAWRRGAYRWRRLAAVYGQVPGWLGKPLAERRMQNLILRGGAFGWQSHNGITTVAVFDKGLRFSLMVPFSIDHPPFFIPFADLKATRTDWYLNTESYELDTRREPEIKLILDHDLMRWIEAKAGQRWSAGYSLLHHVPNIDAAGGAQP